MGIACVLNGNSAMTVKKDPLVVDDGSIHVMGIVCEEKQEFDKTHYHCQLISLSKAYCMRLGGLKMYYMLNEK